ncbi:MAG TPA: DUF6353 family protein, partial [Anaerolineales bacterium]|nr:DUF6353 family protein [Anaerolineales bacterium]
MQIINQIKAKGARFVADNATTLLTAGGVVGVVGTAVLAFRGGYKTAGAMADDRDTRAMEARTEDMTFEEALDAIEPLSKIEAAKLAVPHVVPPVITGGLTIAAVILANRMSGQRAAAL